MLCLAALSLLGLIRTDVKPPPAVSAAFLQRTGTELLLDGEPFRCVSVNKFDLALQFLRGGEEREKGAQAIRDIGRHGFRAIRFGAIGFWPKDGVMDLWGTDQYWKRMDDLVATARQANVWLIPVLYWNTYLFPDMAGETVQDMITNRDSRSRQFLDLYFYQMVSRYRNEPTILLWELWSELNLGADLEFARPYGFSDLNAIAYGASPTRLRRDNYTTEQMIPFLRELAEFVRKLDPNHLISSGHAAPRPAAQHLRLAHGKGDWTEDSPEEAQTYLRDTHPDPIDIISIHFYAVKGFPADSLRLGNKDPKSAVVLRKLKEICDQIGKPVIIGETGGEAYEVPPNQCGDFTKGVMEEATAAGYPIILYWMGRVNTPLEFDLDRCPATNKLLLDSQRRLKERASRTCLP